MAIGAKPTAEDANILGMLRDEIGAINERRRALGRQDLQPPADPLKVVDAVGLSLSGGGIRSAAVSLGVLQALNHHNVIRNIDYLSTVSGGGYIGSALTASMTVTEGQFVFGQEPTQHSGAPPPSEISDTDAVGHIRNYSNYLVPAGLRDFVTGAAIVVRGLVANLGIVLPIVLLAAAVMVWSNPDRDALHVTDLVGFSLERFLPVAHFGITLGLSLLGLLIFFLWALRRSFFPPDKLSEFRTPLPFLGGSYLVALAVAFFFELQPFVVEGMFQIGDKSSDPEHNVLFGLVTGWLETAATVVTPIAAAMTLFRQQFGVILKAASDTSGLTTRIMAIAAKGLMWVAGAAVPLLIWIAFLYLSYWGIINIKTKGDRPACPPGAVAGVVKIDPSALTCGGNIDLKFKVDGCATCPAASGARTPDAGKPQKKERYTDGQHTPPWLLSSANVVSRVIAGRVIDRPMWLFYGLVGLLFYALSWLLTPNANSLHRLYRDRLSKAFLFDPRITAAVEPIKRNETSLDQGRDFAPLDTLRMSALSPKYAPYHLINAALNIQGSDYANRRGRNADFFLFSPLFIGSHATDYAPMAEFERAAPQLDLATAMAISGAAASSNMGAASIRPLTPTLALLNVRLGYWLKNPRYWLPTEGQSTAWNPAHRSTMYLWSEISGRLYENADEIYLTDGGHIENLGIYELLRRRCRVIIAVDAEADPAMHFPSFVTLQRYARIDLGARIDLPWEPIQQTTLAWMSEQPKPGEPPRQEPTIGPHVAIGKIDYGSNEIGYLLYVKSSLTGDENDYVRDYARRYKLFPHESTGDQFFSEEQFEVYRALGFHMMHGALCGADDIEVAGESQGVTVKFTDGANDVVTQVRARLMP